MPDKLTNQQKKEIRKQLYERDGKRCHYCGIDKKDFPKIWGTFYGGIKRGQTLEIDHKDNKKGNDLTNLVLACALCNMAKSDKFTYDEFLKVGKVIEEIWRNRWRKRKGKIVK
jgi:5-methylcytosine-specific restriction endonuclease McrA